MKTLHVLNKTVAGALLLLKSFSGAGLVLFIVFLFDLGTNALGIQVFIGQRMVHMIEALDMSHKTAFIASALFSLLASSTLGLVIMQATLHNKKSTNALLSFLSVCLSFMGLAFLIFEKGFKWADLAGMDMNMSAQLVMVLILSVIAPIAYNMNASLVVETFGIVLDEFNEASKQELKKAFSAEVEVLAKEDIASTKKKSNKRLRKLGVKPQPAPVVEKSPIAVGETFDFDNLMSTINDN
jgi:hypothetical protein